MNRKLTACLFAAVLVGQGALHAQKSGTALKPDVFFSNIVVSQRDGRVLYGLLVGLEPEALIIRHGSTDTRLSPKEIAQVVLTVDKHRGRFMMYGAVAGIYAGNIRIGAGKNQPTAFAPSFGSAWGTILTNTIYATGGMGLGYLASLFERSEHTFTFSPEPGRLLRDWQGFKDFLSGASRPKRVHVYLQSAQVIPAAAGRYEKVFRKAGYSPSEYFGGAGVDDYVEPASRFNLLRGLRLTFNLSRRLELGAAILFLGEPVVGAYQYSYSFSYPNYSSESHYLRSRLDSTGYFLIASFDMVGGRTDRSFCWKAGTGVGKVKVDFDLNLARSAYGNSYQTETADGYSLDKSVVSPMLFTEVQFPLAEYLSVGLYADYVLAPSQNVPAFPAWNLPGQKIRLGNASVGASLGIHF